MRLGPLFLATAICLCAQTHEDPEVARAKAGVEKLRTLVEAGAAPRKQGSVRLAIAPTIRLTAPRGRRVSASRVMTYRTSGGTCSTGSEASRKVVSLAPRSRRFSS